MDLNVEIAQGDRNFALPVQFLPNATDGVTLFKALKDKRLKGNNFNPSLTPTIPNHNNARI